MKLCRTCDTIKNENEFGVRNASPDGLAHKCKECQSKYDRKRANLQHRIQARLDYARTEAGKIAGSRAKKKWAENNQVKRAAHIILCNYVRDGKVKRLKYCEGCGDKCATHGHHEDYAKPLDVTWLCTSCHSFVHKLRGSNGNYS